MAAVCHSKSGPAILGPLLLIFFSFLFKLYYSHLIILLIFILN